MSSREAAGSASPSARPRPGRLGPLIGLVILILIGSGVGFALVQRPGSERSVTGNASGPLKPAPIDGNRAFGYLKQICDLGPRPAGSAANETQRRLVVAHFEKLGATVREQPFQGRDPISGRAVSMANVIASWHPGRTERIVLCAHYDTRPHPDMEPDPSRRNDPFLGANDGASGVALLMEIAHHLNDWPTPWGVDLVLFDGEELVYGQTGEYFLGSKEFARQYRADRRSGRSKSVYSAGILLDMVAGKTMRLPKEPYSLRFAGRLLRDVWSVADQVGAKAFVDEVGRSVLDDHLALNDAGIPTIDIIDFDYAQWHTADDLPEFCSPRSLEEVGRVVTAWLARPKPTARRP